MFSDQINEINNNVLFREETEKNNVLHFLDEGHRMSVKSSRQIQQYSKPPNFRKRIV